MTNRGCLYIFYMMRNLVAVILAAGKGTRMKSSLPKALHEIAGRPMLFYPVNVLKKLGVQRIIVVVGHAGADVIKTLSCARGATTEKITFVEQKKQLGTGHAVLCALRAIKGFKGGVLILSGDVPLITETTLKALVKLHCKGKLSLITAVPGNRQGCNPPTGYGRILRNANNAVIQVVEEKDATPEQKTIQEINTGIYLISSEFLFANIKKIGSKNAQKEYCLPDLVRLAVQGGLRVKALTHLDPDEVMGVNNRAELAKAALVMRLRIAHELMLSGVTVIHPETAYIDHGVRVGPDTVIHPCVHLGGRTSIAGGCVIEQGAVITDSSIGKGSIVKSCCVIDQARIGNAVVTGPFARIRPGTVIKNNARVGNFVEVKKSVIGSGARANHLSYLGDAVIGSGVNIGAGVITCNYDGFKKHVTTIEDNAFIGSDSQLVAPVRVGRGAYVGSGTTVTKDVPPGSLVTSRAGEKIIKGWAAKRKKNG